MKLSPILLLLVIMTSCQPNAKQQQVQTALSQWQNKTVIVPK
jgi:hypothetical protein